MHFGIFNVDDPFGAEWIHEFQSRLKVCGYSLNPHVPSQDYPMVIAKEIQPHIGGIRGYIVSPWGEGPFESRLLGQFNVTHLLSIVATLGLMGFRYQDIVSTFPTLNPVRGRMQIMGGGKHPTVVIDFAHKQDALKKVLEALRVHCQGRLVCVFGCGGNKDRGKRPIMAKLQNLSPIRSSSPTTTFDLRIHRTSHEIFYQA